MNGVMKFKPKWFTLFRPLLLAGGPYTSCPQTAFGVCLLERIPKGMLPQVWLPIEDYHVPEDPKSLDTAIRAVLSAMLEGELVYVGCMAGRGRTGLFISLLSKILAPGIDPVMNVRSGYYSHAVETEEQKAFVDEFDPTPYRKWLFWAALDVARGKSLIEYVED